MTLVSDPLISGHSGVWVKIDPLADCSLVDNAAGLQLVIPSNGTDHDDYQTLHTALKLVQACGDGDFDVQVRFKNAPSANFAGAGLIAMSSDGLTFVRSDGYWNGSAVTAYGASETGGTQVQHSTGNSIAPTSGVWGIGLKRVGNVFTLSRSNDGSIYVVDSTFTFAMTVTYVGLHISTSAGVPWTAQAQPFTVNSDGTPASSGTASAGADQMAAPGAPVTLDGSGSSGSVVWSQTAGPTVTLSSTTAASPTFTAPNVTTDTTLTFRQSAGSTSATTNVFVKPSGRYNAGAAFLLDTDMRTPTTLKTVLVDGLYIADKVNHAHLSDVPSARRIATSGNRTGLTVSAAGVFTMAAASLGAPAGGRKGVTLVTYVDTGTESTSTLLWYQTQATGLPITTDGSTLTTTPSAAGIFGI